MPSKIVGKNAVISAADSKRKFFEVYVSYQNLNSCESVLKYAESKDVKINILRRAEMDLKFPKDKHQGIVAYVEDYKYADIGEILEGNENPFIIILDGLEDPQNLGAILRTAEATNVDCVVIPKNRSVGLNHTVAKVSTGAIEYVPFPEKLKGAYQSYTQADISSLRDVGYTDEFYTVEQGVPEYLSWLAAQHFIGA